MRFYNYLPKCQNLSKYIAIILLHTYAITLLMLCKTNLLNHKELSYYFLRWILTTLIWITADIVRVLLDGESWDF